MLVKYYNNFHESCCINKKAEIISNCKIDRVTEIECYDCHVVISGFMYDTLTTQLIDFESFKDTILISTTSESVNIKIGTVFLTVLDKHLPLSLMVIERTENGY